MRRMATALATVSILAVSFSAAPADAAARIRILAVQYDSPGSDTGANRSLNAEWVRLKNEGTDKKNIRGWTLSDRSGHVYRFRGLVLAPGRSVRVRTGKGADTRRNRYWRQDQYVWNNTGDRATLKNRRGTTVDMCSWGDGDGKIRC